MGSCEGCLHHATSRQTSARLLLCSVAAQLVLLFQQSSFVVRWPVWHSCKALGLHESEVRKHLTTLQRAICFADQFLASTSATLATRSGLCYSKHSSPGGEAGGQHDAAGTWERCRDAGSRAAAWQRLRRRTRLILRHRKCQGLRAPGVQRDVREMCTPRRSALQRQSIGAVAMAGLSGAVAGRDPRPLSATPDQTFFNAN